MDKSYLASAIKYYIVLTSIYAFGKLNTANDAPYRQKTIWNCTGEAVGSYRNKVDRYRLRTTSIKCV